MLELNLTRLAREVVVGSREGAAWAVKEGAAKLESGAVLTLPNEAGAEEAMEGASMLLMCVLTAEEAAAAEVAVEATDTDESAAASNTSVGITALVWTLGRNRNCCPRMTWLWAINAST